MSQFDNFIIGPIADIYVGNSESEELLRVIAAPRTQGGRFRYIKPRAWNTGAGKMTQTGLVLVTAELTFYWSEDACRIAMTNSIEDPLPAIDEPPSNQTYSVLLLVDDPESRASIYLPVCEANCEVENPFLKTEGTTLPVTFMFSERNAKKQIVHRGTYTELDTILDTRSPL